MTDLWYGTSGPPDAEIVLVGESWGVEEANAQKPFVGQSGVELNRMLAEAQLDRNKILATNVVAARPPNNETWRFFLPKEANKQRPRVGGLLPSDNTVSECRRLYAQISAFPRKLVIGTGNYALWALSNCNGAEALRQSNGKQIPSDLQTYAPNGIMNWRGSMWYIDPRKEFTSSEEQSHVLGRTKFLPIVHPAAILRQWELRSSAMHDLKQRVPLGLSNDWRPNPQPTFLSPPTLGEAVGRLCNWLWRANRGEDIWLANDIETVRHRFISVMGFADSTNFAMCIPFIRRGLPDGSFESYWPTDQEAELLFWIRKVLTHPRIRVIGQNYIYDTQYIQYEMGCKPVLTFDTMLAQNVVFPGTPKDLSYLSSLYCTYHWYWKDDVKDWNAIEDLQTLMDYNCLDNIRTWEVCDSQRKYIAAIGQEKQMAFKMQTNDLCLRMMNRGVLIDTKRRGSMLSELQDALTALEHELLGIIPQDMVKPLRKKADKFWYRSAKQTAELFYDILGFKVVKNRKTGNRTIGKEALMQLEKWYPEFTGLFRRLDTYGSADNTAGVIQSPIEWDGRMRCSYNPGGTETHRLSSSQNVFKRGTNLQNLTKGEEDD